MALSEEKKKQIMQQMAEELRKKHDLELYKECLEIGTMIYEIARGI